MAAGFEVRIFIDDDFVLLYLNYSIKFAILIYLNYRKIVKF